MSNEPTLSADDIEAIKAEIRTTAGAELKAFAEAQITLEEPLIRMAQINNQLQQAKANGHATADLEQQLAAAQEVLRSVSMGGELTPLSDKVWAIFISHHLDIRGVDKNPLIVSAQGQVTVAAQIYRDVAKEAIDAVRAARAAGTADAPQPTQPDVAAIKAEIRTKAGAELKAFAEAHVAVREQVEFVHAFDGGDPKRVPFGPRQSTKSPEFGEAVRALQPLVKQEKGVEEALFNVVRPILRKHGVRGCYFEDPFFNYGDDQRLAADQIYYDVAKEAVDAVRTAAADAGEVRVVDGPYIGPDPRLHVLTEGLKGPPASTEEHLPSADRHHFTEAPQVLTSGAYVPLTLEKFGKLGPPTGGAATPSQPPNYVQVPAMNERLLEADAREHRGGWRP